MATTYTVGDGKTYINIQDAIDVIPDNLSGTGIHIVEVYAGGTANVYNECVDAFTGFTNAGPDDRIIIRGMIDHKGQIGQGVIIDNNAPGIYGAGIAVVDFTTVEMISITSSLNTQNSTSTGVLILGDYCLIDKCIAYGLSHSLLTYGFIIGYLPDPLVTSTDNVIRNCIAVNLSATDDIQEGQICAGFCASTEASGWFVNCTSYNMSALNPTANCSNYFGYSASYFECWNCIGSTTNALGPNFKDFLDIGSLNISVEYCISSDDSADDWAGTGAQINKDPSTDIKFNNINPGSEDLHITSGSCAIDSASPTSPDMIPDTPPMPPGIDYRFTDDIDGETRPCGTRELWDVGVDELCGAEEGGCCETCCCCVTKRYFNGY